MIAIVIVIAISGDSDDGQVGAVEDRNQRPPSALAADVPLIALRLHSVAISQGLIFDHLDTRSCFLTWCTAAQQLKGVWIRATLIERRQGRRVSTVGLSKKV